MRVPVGGRCASTPYTPDAPRSTCVYAVEVPATGARRTSTPYTPDTPNTPGCVCVSSQALLQAHDVLILPTLLTLLALCVCVLLQTLLQALDVLGTPDTANTPGSVCVCVCVVAGPATGA